MQDKIALVTGSTSGIGRGIAERFASLGASVVVHGPYEAEAREVARQLGEKGFRTAAVGGARRRRGVPAHRPIHGRALRRD